MDIKSLIQKARTVCKRTSVKIVTETKKLYKIVSLFVKKHRVLTTVILAVAVMFMLMSVLLIQRKDVEIFVDGKQTAAFVTLKQKPEAWLETAGISLDEQDGMTVNGSTVKITRAFYITVTADGKDSTIKTLPCSVFDALRKAGVTLSQADEINFPKTKLVEKNDNIIVTRVVSKKITETEKIKYETTEKKTSKLYVGETQVSVKGEKGEKELVYEVTYKDGKETSRKLISETVTKQPVDKVVLVGTKEKPKVTTTSTPKKYKKVITMKASAYTYGEDGGNITATGIRPYYGVVAVDPKVIPLGTKLYIETADGSFVYGEAVAADTGGSIKGNRIDLFLNSKSACRKFGKKTVNVYIL